MTGSIVAIDPEVIDLDGFVYDLAEGVEVVLCRRRNSRSWRRYRGHICRCCSAAGVIVVLERRLRHLILVPGVVIAHRDGTRLRIAGEKWDRRTGDH